MLEKAGREGFPPGCAPHGHVVEPSLGAYVSLVGPAGGVRIVVKVGSTFIRRTWDSRCSWSWTVTRARERFRRFTPTGISVTPKLISDLALSFGAYYCDTPVSYHANWDPAMLRSIVLPFNLQKI